MGESNSTMEKGNKALAFAALVIGTALVAACGNSQAKDEARKGGGIAARSHGDPR